MTVGAIKRWSWVHKWSSLVCAAFLLMLCLTGLPLIFSEEIAAALDDDPPLVELPANTPRADLDRIIADSLLRYPGEIVRAIGIDDEKPVLFVTLAPAQEAAPELNHSLKYDARTAELLEEFKPDDDEGLSFLAIMAFLHVQLFAGLPGTLFLGAMGVLFVVATVSGIVLYAPFMRKLPFGTVRRERSRRASWLDLHNLLGIATAAWVLVVGLTGALNTLARPMFALWQATSVPEMTAGYRNQPIPSALGSVQRAVETAQQALPGMTVISVFFPSREFGSPHHYLIWAKGETALTSRLFTPALIDAQTGQLTAAEPMPWYLWTLDVSRPLHFGDYGGLPLKIIWALFDMAAILVLGSGIYLWLSRRNSPLETRFDETENGGTTLYGIKTRP